MLSSGWIFPFPRRILRDPRDDTSGSRTCTGFRLSCYRLSASTEVHSPTRVGIFSLSHLLYLVHFWVVLLLPRVRHALLSVHFSFCTVSDDGLIPLWYINE